MDKHAWCNYTEGRESILHELQYDIEADAYIRQRLLVPYYNETVQALRNIKSDTRLGLMNIPQSILSVVRNRWAQI